MKKTKRTALLKDYETKAIVGYTITTAHDQEVVYFGFGAGNNKDEILYLSATGKGLEKAIIDRSMTPQDMKDIIEEMNLFQFAVTLVSEPGRKRI